MTRAPSHVSFYSITIKLDNALVTPTSADSHCMVFDDDDNDDGSVGKDVGRTKKD